VRPCTRGLSRPHRLPPLLRELLTLKADERVFPDPGSSDAERPNSRRTLAFGRGIHFCIGSALGRLEAALAPEELIRRFPQLRLEDQEIPSHPNISFRGPQQLWVRAIVAA
jgi:cytochrome P450